MAARTEAARKAPAGNQRPAVATLRTLRRHAAAQIEAHLRDAGFDDPSELKERGSYVLDLGDVVGRATVGAMDGEMTYTVAAKVLPLPSDKELVVPLLRELLELNAGVRGPARLAVVGDSVFAGVHDVVDVVPDQDFGRYIDATLVLAQDALKVLSRRYGKTVRKRKR